MKPIAAVPRPCCSTCESCRINFGRAHSDAIGPRRRVFAHAAQMSILFSHRRRIHSPRRSLSARRARTRKIYKRPWDS